MVDGRLFLRYTSQQGGLDLGYEIEERLNLDGGSFTTVVAREEECDRVRHNPSGPQLPIFCVYCGLPKPEPVDDSQVRSVADAVLVIPKHQK